jgi:hypothetical protein
LTDGAYKLETNVDPTIGLKNIQVIASSQQWLLIVNDQQLEPKEAEPRRRTNPSFLLPVNGRIFALDRETGRSLWPVPAVVRGYGMLPNQPEEVPTLWLLRPKLTTSNQFGPSTEARIDVLCLDRRTGAALYPPLGKGEVASHANSYDILVDLRKHEVTLALPQIQIQVRFTSEPTPPAPPFQQAHDGNRLNAAFGKFGELIESVKDALVPMPKNDPFK